MRILQLLLFNFTERIYFCVNFYIGQFELVFMHKVQIFMEVFINSQNVNVIYYPLEFQAIRFGSLAIFVTL
jgi:hypothetical protein